MATANPKATTRAKSAKTNTSAAAVPGINADVSASGATQVAPQALVSQAGQTASEEGKTSPLVGDGSGDKLKFKALKISSKVEGFRRAGRPWTVEAKTVQASDFSEEQIEMLLAESMLRVEFVK